MLLNPMCEEGKKKIIHSLEVRWVDLSKLNHAKARMMPVCPVSNAKGHGAGVIVQM